VSIQHRLRQVADVARCGRCGLSLLQLRRHLRDTLEIIRRELPPARADEVVEELRRIWTT
jgi:hypothetical protein